MKTIYNHIDELRRELGTYPAGVSRRISNYLDRIALTARKHDRRAGRNSITTPEPVSEETSRQIADRYIAKKAIFEAMLQGRRITLKNSHEFRVSEMHTQMHCIRRDIEDKALPYVLESRWVECGTAGKKCKEYWLEVKEDEA